MSKIVLYASVFSRSFIAHWMLLELGVPYEVVDTDIRTGMQKAPAYLKLNPMGKVPTLVDDGVVVTELPAICLHLADKYGYGTLAPKIEDPMRGTYLRWTVFSTTTFEPAAYLGTSDAKEARGVGWGTQKAMLDTLERALTPGPWLLGDRFSAADIALGGVFSIAYFNKRFPARPVFDAYYQRLSERPANK
ncbi:MAG: glutathione S-transferase family protein, partial [Alphaproteobacteria bacterium]|nr:glutathione S-transferase family protein [Alphaproteobacteria bacterium]